MIKRSFYLDKMAKLMDTEDIKVITGVRRCGKTVLLKQIIDELKNSGIASENIIYINFESSKYKNIKNDADLDEFVFSKTKNLNGKVYLLFDEIQKVKNWEVSLNSYRVDLDCDIYITGSNSKLLSGELATLLSGRYLKIDLYPFSFNELLEYYKITNGNLTKQDEQHIFNNYLKYGGFPRVLDFDDDEKMDYLMDIYSAIVLKDILHRNNIRNLDFLERLIKFLITNTGQIFSINSIKKYLKHENINVSTNTISTYLKHIMEAYILLKAPKEEIKTKKLLTINEKYYCIDPGFYQLQSSINKSRGQLLENIIFLELIRRNYNVTVGNIGKQEIDFICKKHDKTIYIQVSESILDENTRKREFNPLEQINDNYPKYVLTLDDWDYSQNGIIHLNIIEFLKSNII